MKTKFVIKKIALMLMLFIVSINGYAQSASDSLLKRNTKVYIVASDSRSIEYGQDAIRGWNYWQIVDKQSDADAVVNFKIRACSIGEHKGHIEITDAKTNELILKTKVFNTALKGRWDTKRACVENLVNKRLIPMIE